VGRCHCYIKRIEIIYGPNLSISLYWILKHEKVRKEEAYGRLFVVFCRQRKYLEKIF